MRTHMKTDYSPADVLALTHSPRAGQENQDHQTQQTLHLDVGPVRANKLLFSADERHLRKETSECN